MANLRRKAEEVQSHVNTLVTLPLSAQTKFLCLRASLNVRLSHFPRTMLSEALEPL